MIEGRIRARFTVRGIVVALFLTIGIGMPRHSSAASTYYVATNGNDSWSGTVAAPNGTDGPFKTLSKAQNAVRSQIAAGMTSDITVLVRAGEYPETSLYFGSVDSGRNGYKVVWRNYPGEQPLIHGGRRITGWQQDTGNIYKVPLDRNFHTLYENGVRGDKARHPNTTASNPYVYNRTATVISGADTTEFGFGAGDIPLVSSPNALEVVIWPGGPDGIWNWEQRTFTLSGIDYASGIVTLLRDTCCGQATQTPWAIGIGSRYYVQGAKEFLDQAGEFWIGNGYLYYWPRQTPIEDQVIIAPAQVGAVLNLGGPSSMVANIQIEGLAIGYTDRNVAGIRLDNAQQVAIKGNHILNTGESGIAAAGPVSNNTIEGNLLHDIGTDGISLYGESNIGYPSEFMIKNNHIYHVGQLRGSSSSISIGRSSNNTVSHNLIHDVPRAGLRSYGSANYSSPVFDAANNTYEYNDVSRAMLDSQDGGPLHFSGVGPGISINNNRFHDTIFNLPYAYGQGIYTDVCNVQTTITNNVIDGLQQAIPSAVILSGIEIKGSNISASNNVIAQNRISRGEVDINSVDSNCPNVQTQDASIQRNIFASNGTSSIYSFPNFQETQLGAADYNLFYHDSGIYNVGFGYGDSVRTFSSTTQSLEQWRGGHVQSYDRNSIIADPRFVDARNRDFRLRPDSPAYRLGFQDIDFAAIGLSADFPFSGPSESLARLFVKTVQSGPGATTRLAPGDTTQLMVSARTQTGYLVTPAASILTFSSDQPAIATIDVEGKITAGSAGFATITVTATQGEQQKSTMMYVDVAGTLSLAQTDCLFNWAEDHYPAFFSPARPASAVAAPYYFRFYGGTGAYLATASNDRHLYYLGPLSDNTILDLGAASAWYTTAGCH